MKKIFSIGIILLFVGLSLSTSTGFKTVEQSNTISSNGNTLYVGGSGPGNYTKIQDAIDNASDGDTVFVYDDNSPYTGYIHVDKSVNIIGENKFTTVVLHDDYYCFAFNVDGVNISGFTLQNTDKCDYGIRVWETSNHCVKDNIIIGMDLGIYLMHSNNNFIMKNEMKDGGTGVVVGYDSSLNNISDNDFFNNSCGVSLTSSSKNNTISNNYLTGCGFSVGSDSYQNTFFGNLINDKPFLFLVNEQNLVFDGIDVGEIILINCKNITTQNLEISESTYGMKLIYTDDCIITNNTFKMNKYSGIVLSSCNNNTITNNYIYSNSGNGISLYSDYPARCSFNNISENYIFDNMVNGVSISESNNNIISGNTIQGNGFKPSYYRFGSGLFLAFDADYNKISHNIIQDNYHGLSIRYSLYNSISQNLITNNSENGIYLDKSGFNSIKFNNLISNKKDVSFFKYLLLRNNLRRNYWDNWIGFGPMFIFGKRMIRTGTDYWGQPVYSPIPWIIFDWHPAQEPYDIEA
jgi:parallel beta-helix repeat protein